MPKKKKLMRAKKKTESEEKPKKLERYFEAIGRRKTSIARVRLWISSKRKFLVNSKPLENYFPTLELQQTATASLQAADCLDKMSMQVLAKGGGLHSQAEAVRHGTARTLVLFDSKLRKKLKRAGFLTRDPRMRERKKFGLKRARRAPQWQKR